MRNDSLVSYIKQESILKLYYVSQKVLSLYCAITYNTPIMTIEIKIILLLLYLMNPIITVITKLITKNKQKTNNNFRIVLKVSSKNSSEL